MNKSLFKIQAEYVDAIMELEEYLMNNDTDEIPDEFNDRLFINKDEFADKARDYRLALKQIKADQAMLNEEIVRLNQLVVKKQKTYDIIESYMAKAMLIYGNVTKTGNIQFKTPFINMSWIHTKPVEVLEVSMLPAEFIRTKVSGSLTKVDADWLMNKLVSIAKMGDEDDAIKLFHIQAALKFVDEANKSYIKETLQNDVKILGATIDTEAGYLRYYDTKESKINED